MTENATVETERPPDTPSEWTYRHYRGSVETARDEALTKLAEYPEDTETLHEAVDASIQGSPRFTNYGHMLMTVLLSDQTPDRPDHCQRWSAYVNLSNDNPPTWSDCVGEMAYVCYYSDVFDAVIQSPPGFKWERTNARGFKHRETGLQIDVGETQGGFYRVDAVSRDSREPVGDGDTLADALDVAAEWIEDHPEGEL